jgi:hypothetical protein
VCGRKKALAVRAHAMVAGATVAGATVAAAVVQPVADRHAVTVMAQATVAHVRPSRAMIL